MGHFTIEMWVKPAAADQFHTLFSYTTDGNDGFSLILWNDHSLLIGNAASPDADFASGIWHHIAVTRTAPLAWIPDNPTCEYTFFKDGVQLGGPVEGELLYINDPGCVVLGQSQNGKECGGFLDYLHWRGSMTEVRLWNSVRTSAEMLSDIAPLWRRIGDAAAANEPELVALWPLDCMHDFVDIKGGHHLGSCSPATPASGAASYSLANIVDMDCPCTLVTVKPT
jgi:hypothetical protein